MKRRLDVSICDTHMTAYTARCPACPEPEKGEAVGIERIEPSAEPGADAAWRKLYARSIDDIVWPTHTTKRGMV